MGFAFFQGGTHPFKSGQSRAVLGLHAEGGFGEESAAVGSDLVDGAGVVVQKWAWGVHGVVVVFCFVSFPHPAQLFAEGFHFGMNFRVFFGFGVDFSSSQKIIQRTADAAFITQERQINGPPTVFACEF